MTAPVSTTETPLYGLDDESRQMVLDTIAQLRKRLLTREKIFEFDREEIFPEEIIREMLGPEIGLQLLFIPEEYGGLNGGARDCCAVTRETAKICLGVATAFFAIQLGADPILVGATHEQKERWLGAIAEGDTLVAYAVTEAGAGSNVQAIQTRAEEITGEDGQVTAYKINGNKQFISTGGYADFVTVLANTPQGPSFFVVEKDAEGFVRGKGEEKHGIRASNTSPLTFTDVVVPADYLIGLTPGKGLKQANKVFGYTRLMVAALGLGAADAALDIVIPYAKERIQFNTPLSEKQGYTHKLVVPNAVRVAAASAYVDEIALRIDSGELDLQVEGSIAKYFATEISNRTAEDAIQALGGYGYITEFGVEKIKRDVKITCIYEGTSEIQQNIISTFRWKKTRKTKGEYYLGIAREMEQAEEGALDAGCRLYAACARTLNESIQIAHENRLTRQQAVMFALADMMTYVEVGAALARKACVAVKKGDSNGEIYSAMSRVFAAEVSQLVAANCLKVTMGTDLLSEEDTATVRDRLSLSDLMTGCRHVFTDMDQVADFLFDR